MKTILGWATVCFGILLAGLVFYGGTDNRASPNWAPIKDAGAVVGRPLTPGSVAGVSRRTSRRVVRRTTTYVATLPPSCQTVVIEGTALQQCGGTYYQASGAQYVVVDVQ
jgi:hypothetical protein